MRKLLGPTRAGFLALFLVFTPAGTVGAVTLEWSGTYQIIWGDLPMGTFIGSGTGVSTVSTSGAAGDIAPFAHLDGIRFDGGITATGTAPLTDPDNATLVTLRIDKTVAGRVGIPLGRGTLAPISGGGPLTDNQLTGLANPAPRFKQCLSFEFPPAPGDCSIIFFPIPVTRNGTRGIGIGGTATVNTFSKGNGARFSIVGTPWTVGAAVITGVPNRITLTQNGVITSRFTITETRTVSGFAHGPVSNTSSTAKLSGVVQFVTPAKLLSNVLPPTPIFTILKLHFVPEPSLVLLLVSGVAGLVAIGRSRIRP